MKNLCCEVIAVLCGAQYIGKLPAGELSAVTTDSREVIPGALFCAIQGARADGHDFLSSAKEKGALCALVEHEVAVDLPQLVVPSTQQALQTIAAYYRGGFKIPFIGITGSVGKTTAKEMIYSILSERFCTLKTEKNFNNELGVPFTLFRLAPEHQAAVVEMGISDFGEMTRLSAMVHPDIAVFTLIGDAHLEQLHSRDGVLKAKSEILHGMKPEGIVIANGDDDLLKCADFEHKTVLFGLGDNCDLQAIDISSDGEKGTRCKFCWQEREIPVYIPAYGQHMIYAALMGAAVGLALGLSDAEIVTGIEKFQNVGHRDRILHCRRFTVVDDCYNSNPSSAAAAIRSLVTLPGRHVCILGDMLELGAGSAELHRQIGKLAADKGCTVIACGPTAKYIAEGAGEKAQWFESTSALIKELPRLAEEGDSILVKASRAMRFEDISEALTAL